MQNSSKITYIQGLRALCVLVVLGFHLDETWLPSGFLGVDAFFAISGFVITRMILNQLQCGQFSLRSFYYSRVSKLLPPLLLVIVISIILFSTLYSGQDLYEMYVSGMYSVISLSNFYFYFDAGYFSSESIYKPFLHTWSLSVEEQFYLVWPLLLLWLSRKGKLSVGAALLSTTALIIVSLFLVTRYFDLVFYLMPFRAYQLLLGISAALFCYNYERAIVVPFTKYVMLIAPFVLFALTLIDLESPTVQMSAQIVASLMIALACCAAHMAKVNKSGSENSLIKKTISGLFESRVSSYLGDRSYHIYLVHWPVICFVVYAAKDISGLNKLLLGLLSIVLAELLCRFTKGVKLTSIRKLSKPSLAIMIFLVFFAIFPGIYNLTLQNFIQLDHRTAHTPKVEQLQKELNEELNRLHCNIAFKPGKEVDAYEKLKKCLDKDVILVVGDSLTGGVSLGIVRLLPNKRVVRLHISGCPPYFGDDPEQLELFHKIRSCARFSSYPWTAIKSELRKVDAISLVVAGNWQARAYNTHSLQSSIAEISTVKSRVFLIGVRPAFTKNVARLFESGYFETNSPDLEKFLLRVKNSPPTRVLNETMRRIAYDNSNIFYVDVFADLCGDKCIVMRDHDVLYRDASHLSLAGVDYLTKQENFKSLVSKLD